ncbi:hypothetical protein BT63DRAFT_421736 [Microthyrium microscopicum]|uniref:Uncharacterized protein n=1 Tax=Microthyrium microscopicum TaxID=703497 RepID=A0A6A6UQ79_9PEZI|nr:hypothetical protein BT63DRAFT_421736 [Microthyrium microscopicum]
MYADSQSTRAQVHPTSPSIPTDIHTNRHPYQSSSMPIDNHNLPFPIPTKLTKPTNPQTCPSLQTK